MVSVFSTEEDAGLDKELLQKLYELENTRRFKKGWADYLNSGSKKQYIDSTGKLLRDEFRRGWEDHINKSRSALLMQK